MSDSVDKNVRMCKDCKTRPVKPQRNAKRPFYRCEECHRAYKREEMRRLRQRVKDQVQENEETKTKRCTRCGKLKPYSAFSYSQRVVRQQLNKVCDSCLTKLYANQHKHSPDMTPEWWRARAYGANQIARTRLAKERDVPTSSVSLSDLDWVCNPMDLVDIYEKQDKKCVFCGCVLTKDNMCIDHKTPVSKGGRHELSNLELTCKDCNILKLDRTVEEFTVFVEQYANRIISRSKG